MANNHHFPAVDEALHWKGAMDDHDANNSKTIPFAIVGMSCLLPGGCKSPSDLWDLLKNGRSGHSKIPESRINIDGFYHPRRERPGSIDTDGGYFIENSVWDFDPSFFGISATESFSMDPQQRKALEIAYQALESAGITLDMASGSKTGCFVANFTFDFLAMQYRDGDFGTCHPQAQTGLGQTLLSNRVSYAFNLLGPSVTLDSACSSSLYALQLACQSLADSSCDGALVMATNLILSVEQYLSTQKLGVLSPTSTCHCFDAAADGYARAEGINALYIKRLDHAVRDNDTVKAVIRSTSFNANGKSPGGITNPNPLGQEAAIRTAYERVPDIEYTDTGYFECHATGTPVGDPLEVQALGEVFASGRTIETPLLMGAVKAQLGHSEAASGITAIMKCVLALQHGTIPKTVGVETLNPQIDFRDGKLKVVTEELIFPTDRHGRHIASVNSFGYGGANAHTILQDTESALKQYGFATDNGVLTASMHVNGYAIEREMHLLVVSSHNEKTLNRHAKAIAGSVDKYSLPELSYTLGQRRTHHDFRGYCIIDKQLPVSTQINTELVTGHVKTKSPKICFVFTGQGAQWPQMGLQLLKEFPIVQKTIRYLDKALQALGENGKPTWTIEETKREPRPETGVFDRSFTLRVWKGRATAREGNMCSQTVCTALQIAIVELFSTWNIFPTMTVGHSSGEIAAAYSAGQICMDDAIKIAYLRGFCVAHHCNLDGAMLAVGLNVNDTDVKEYQKIFERHIKIACINSPRSITISGDAQAVIEIGEMLNEVGTFNRLLKTGGKAYHSHHMKAAGSHYESALKLHLNNSGLCRDSPYKCRMISSVTPERTMDSSTFGPKYWRENMESPVLFQHALRKTLDSGKDTPRIMMEIGPHNALASAIRDTCDTQEKAITYIPSIVRSTNSVRSILAAAGSLFLNGYSVDLAAVNAVSKDPGKSSQRRPVDLPSYLWDYSKKYWRESRPSIEFRQRVHPRHDILGSLVPGVGHHHRVWRNILRTKDVSWLSHHKVDGTIVFPFAGYLAMAAESIHQLRELDGTSPFNGFETRNLTVKRALILPTDGETEMILDLRKKPINNQIDSAFWYEFNISASPDGRTWSEHAVGSIRGLSEDSNIDVALSERSPSNHGKLLNHEELYTLFDKLGLQYGPAFQGLHDIKVNASAAEATMKTKWVPDEIDEFGSRYFIHPATLDTCFQSALVATKRGISEGQGRLFLPNSVKRMVFRAPKSTPKMLILQSNAMDLGFRTLRLDSSARIPDECSVTLSIEGLSLTASIRLTKQRDEIINRKPFLGLSWKPDITTLTSKDASRLFSPCVNFEIGTYIKDINYLCLLMMQQIYERTDRKRIHQDYLLDQYIWMENNLNNISENTRELVNELPKCDRAKEITRLCKEYDHVCEVNILETLLDRYPDLLCGDQNGLEVLWQNNQLGEFYDTGLRSKEVYTQLSRIVDLLGYQNPSMNVLEIGAGTGSATEIMLKRLRGDTDYKQYGRFVFTDITPGVISSAKIRLARFRDVEYQVLDIDRDPVTQGYEPGSFDVIVSVNCFHATHTVNHTLQHARSLLKPDGYLVLVEATSDTYMLTMFLGLLQSYWAAVRSNRMKRNLFLGKEEWLERLATNGFDREILVLDDFEDTPEGSSVFVAKPRPEENGVNGKDLPEVAVVYRERPTQLSESIVDELANTSKCTPCAMSLSDYISTERPSSTITLSLLDVGIHEHNSSFFANMEKNDFHALQEFIAKSRALFWITPGGIQCEEAPEHGLSYGFARSAMNENPLDTYTVISFSKMDLEDVQQLSRTIASLCILSSSISTNHSRIAEREISIRNNTAYITRLVPHETMNEKYIRERLLDPEEVLYEADRPTAIEILEPGRLETFYFVNDHHQDVLEPDHVVVRVQSAGLSLRSVAVSMGNFDSKDLTFEITGTICNVGRDVPREYLGKRVVAFCQSQLNNYVRVSRELFCFIEDTHDFQELSTMPVSFVTALHAINTLARLEKDETILIQSASGALGQACIQIAKNVGAKIYVTVGSKEKRQFLKDHYAIPEERMFSSRDLTFVNEFLALGLKADVVIATSSSEMLLETFQCLGEGGRFIELGRSDVFNRTNLDMGLLEKNISLHSFDLLLLLTSPPKYHILQRYLSQMLNLYREQKIQPIRPIEAFHISDVSSAFRAFGLRRNGGKVVLTYERLTKEKTIKAKYEIRKSTLDKTATYILVGCLGGLGKSLSRFMVDRGARSLVYLSRTSEGRLSVPSVEVINEFRNSGVEVEVIAGDVSSKEDVMNAVKLCGSRPIKGVVNAAMVLNDALLENMSWESFKATLAPKVRGTLNLHFALQEASQTPDFFITLSSVSGYFGQVSQSNYAAANTFLDSFARFRRSQGLPGTSLALGIIDKVGYVSENQDRLQYLKRIGMSLTALSEHDFLAGIDAAMFPLQTLRSRDNEELSQGYILLGMEPENVMGADSTALRNRLALEPKSAIWTAALDSILRRSRGFKEEETDTSSSAFSERTIKNLILSGNEEAQALLMASIKQHLANFLLLKLDELDEERSISDYGVDSMVAAELRNWTHRAFSVTVGFLELLKPDCTVITLTEMVKHRMLEAYNEQEKKASG